MAFITGYFDESYTHPPAALVYTVAGYISAQPQWTKFQKEWRKVLDAEGVEHFHMKDFQACRPPYDEWSKEKRAKFLQGLHKIINKRVMRGFATSVVVNDWNALTDEQKFVFGVPHLCATINCMKHIANWANRINLREPILYVFEKGSNHDKDLRRLFNESLTEQEGAHYRVERLAFGTKEDSPLQAADIAAYEMTKEISRMFDENNNRPSRASIKNLICPLDEWFYMDKEQFNKILANPNVKRDMAAPDFKDAVAKAKRKGWFE
jgi:hypothetical protein